MPSECALQYIPEILPMPLVILGANDCSDRKLVRAQAMIGRE